MGIVKAGDQIKSRYYSFHWTVVKVYKTKLLLRVMEGWGKPVLEYDLREIHELIDAGCLTVLSPEDCTGV